MKKKFTYEYEVATELIIKSLLGKSFAKARDFQQLFDLLIQAAYEKTKGKTLK
jgi:hypothetical protein